MRHRGVATLAADLDGESIARAHHRAGRDAELSDRHAGPVVHPENGLHGKFSEQTVVDHALGACTAFFGGLENSVNRAVKILVFCQVACRVKQHRGMPVVTATVHFSRVATGMLKGVELLHGEGVDIGAQPNCAGSGCAARDDAHHTCSAQSSVNWDAPFL